MIFENPLGFLGLLALPAILFLHMLRERRRRYVVSSLDLWSFLEAEPRGPRTRRIPLTWLLLLDLLIGALISLAWAEPSIAINQPETNARHLVILIDVSSSMRADDGPASRLVQAKARAGALLDGLGSRDVVTLLAFGRRPRLVADSRRDGLDGMAAQLRALSAGETGHRLQEALALGQASLDKRLPAEFHILTDAAFPLDALPGSSESAYPVRWHFVGSLAENQAVLDLNATPLAEDRLQIFSRIANFGDRPVTRSATLELDGQVVGQAEVQLPADSAVPYVWTIPAGGSQGTAVQVSLQGKDSLAEDDSAAIGLQPGGNVRVVLVAENPAPIQQAIQAIPGTELQVIPPGEYPSSLSEAQAPPELTIFRDFLPETWPEGQVLVVEPPSAGESEQETSLASGDISLYSRSRQEIPTNATLQFPHPDPLVAGIDFSGVRWSRAWILASSPPGFVPLLQAGEAPLILSGNIDGSQSTTSRVVVLLADLNRGNFTKHPAFPILMANLIQTARPAPLPPSIKTGEAVRLPGLAGYQAVYITAPGKAAIELDGDGPAEWDLTLDPGLYRFRLTKPGGEELEYVAGANAGDEVESDLRPRTWAGSSPTGGDPGGRLAGVTLGEAQNFLDLRTWLLAAAILALLAEATLAWKR